MPESLDRNSFFYLQYKRGKITTGQTDTGGTFSHTLLAMIVTPTNAVFLDFIFTDFFTGFSIFSDAITDEGDINILHSMFNFKTNTTYILYDEIIHLPPFPEDFTRYTADSSIAQGYTVPNDGNSFISFAIASNFVPSSRFKFRGSILFRGVSMND